MRTLLLAVVAVVVAVDGYVHGVWTQRWRQSPELVRAVARLERMPATVGDWRGTDLKKLQERAVRLAGFDGYVQRRYERADGAAVTVLLACGRSGPLSVHTPEVCYAGAGFQIAGDTVRDTVQVEKNSGPTEFWKAKLIRPGTVPQRLRIFWSWHAREGWRAPDSPRSAFAGLPALHKMYVTCELPAGDTQPAEAACAEFLTQLLPELDRALFATP
jgi:EpsI family protein